MAAKRDLGFVINYAYGTALTEKIQCLKKKVHLICFAYCTRNT